MLLRRCCSGGIWDKQWEYIYHQYEHVQPIGSLKPAQIGTWQPPVFRRPSWCDKLIDVNVEFGRQANHPCAYWTAEYQAQALGI